MESEIKRTLPRADGSKPRWYRLKDDEYLVLNNYAVAHGIHCSTYVTKLLRREIAKILAREAEKIAGDAQ